ncbi:hypothetical protein ACOMHN_015704 [Nucella lapillus]
MHGVKLKTTKTALVEPNKAEVFFGHTMTMGQSTSTASKLTTDFDSLLDDETFKFNPDLDMRMVDHMGAGFVDSLGDASMDSFTDLSSILIEPSFMEQPEEKADASTSLTFLNMDENMKSQQYSLMNPFIEVVAEDDDNQSSDLAKLSANVGLKRPRTPSLDHDYSNKRARLSPSPSPYPAAPASVESAEESFLVPDFSPASSPSPSVSREDKHKLRREKNNLASKRSREIRKKKFLNYEVEAKRLDEENAQLELRVALLEKLAKDMKDVLVSKLKIKT